MPMMSVFAQTIMTNKYAHERRGRKETWPEIASRVVTEVVGPYMPTMVGPILELVTARKFMPAGRYLASAGRKYPQTNNCFLFFVEDSRQGWGGLMDRSTQSLMTGGGIGIVYSRLRRKNAPILGLGGLSTGPCALMQMVNETGRHVMQGGSRRSAIWAGLHWNHPDIFEFMNLKRWSEHVRDGKRSDFNYVAPMDMTNMSVILDTAFKQAYAAGDSHAHEVYRATVLGGCSTGEPGLSIDVDENEGENGRNACTEVTTADDNDMCNLGSINMARIESLDEMRIAVDLATAFLVCGTLYSKLPLDEMYPVRDKNRRLGLGLMGLHEWLLKRGKRYGPDSELELYMEEYAKSGSYANRHCDKLSISRSIATRAIAPNGTIGIVAETTTGCEPVFAVAVKRRYLHGKIWKAQYVVDPTAHRLIQEGIPVDAIEDAMSLSENVSRRVEFQAWLQRYVDHGISSTINLPQWGTSFNDETTVKAFGDTLMDNLYNLRGITMYPDGARDGQPLTKVPYHEAIKSLGVEFEDGAVDNCKGGVCGT